jgi:hypothetical protein
MPRLSNSLKVFSATDSCSGDKRRARAAMCGQLVWMAWVVWWQGVGQVVRDGHVTLGYLLRRASTSGGHCEMGGDGDVWMASGAVTSFLNASRRGAGNGEPRRRSCSGRSSRKMSAAVVVAGGGPGEVWRAEASEAPRRDRLGERDWLRQYGGQACAMSGGGDGGIGTA